MHGMQSNPDAMTGRNALPIIADVEMHCLGVHGKTKQAVLRLGMACDIGQGLLRDAVDRRLHGGGYR